MKRHPYLYLYFIPFPIALYALSWVESLHSTAWWVTPTEIHMVGLAVICGLRGLWRIIVTNNED